MSSKLNKGITITTSAVFEAIVLLILIILIFWFFANTAYEAHLKLKENRVEKMSIEVANAMLSSKELTYEENGKVLRGVLDKEKLDAKFYKIKEFPLVTNVKEFAGCVQYTYNNNCSEANIIDILECIANFLSDITGCVSDFILDNFGPTSDTNIFKNYEVAVQSLNMYTTPIDVSVGFPNTYTYVVVLDLENCDENGHCESWQGVINSPTSLGENYIFRFGECLLSNINLDLNTIVSAGLFAGLWTPFDIDECVNNVFGGNAIYNNIMSRKGLPVLIKYGNGETHIGRIYVGMVQWS